MKRLLLAIGILLAAIIGVVAPAEAIERNFAGSAQLDYHFVPTAQNAKTFPSAFDGFTMELAGKLAVDSIATFDLPTTIGLVLLLAAFVIVANIVVDILYAFIDPRVRY